MCPFDSSPPGGCVVIAICRCERPQGARQSGPLGRPEHSEGSHQAETGMRPPRFARGDYVGLLRSLHSLAMTLRHSLQGARKYNSVPGAKFYTPLPGRERRG